ncbi:pyruvate kinase isozyme G, chloroplastic-like isoform X2 [Humulus lupulus]|uniref:pyruvate kinase isozyme G, chloroplastic-like isoform X2 n=1 Tax=Humulus lupulus TaxID=3486 RepID=UPI002B4184EE|nr:pyruvate kinase isozyme G, chloroplastic-like isoform X2 [Humulus lupulus]
MAALNISTRMSLLKPERTPDFLPSSKRLSDFLAFQSRPKKKHAQKNHAFTVRSMTIVEKRYRGQLNSPNGLAGSPDKYSLYDDQSIEYYSMGQARATPNSRRKTKIVCTIGPSTSTYKDWEDIKFGVDNQVDFYDVSFVKDARVVHELKDYLKSCNGDIHVIVKIESADSIPNLHSIIPASDGEDIIRRCQRMQKPVIVATNMLESMINHPTPTRAEVSDIAIAVREGADAVMLSGETAHGNAGNRSFSSNAPLIEISDAQIVVPDLARDLESCSIHTRETSCKQDVDYMSIVEDESESTFHEAFLSRLTETGARESSSLCDLPKQMEGDQQRASEQTKNILSNLVAAVDNLWYLKDGIHTVVLKKLSENGSCRQRTPSELDREVKNLRVAFTDLFLKHNTFKETAKPSRY